jgi:hypothetical protein
MSPNPQLVPQRRAGGREQRVPCRVTVPVVDGLEVVQSIDMTVSGAPVRRARATALLSASVGGAAVGEAGQGVEGSVELRRGP